MQLLDAFQHAGWVGKLVLLILLTFSVFSWGIILVVVTRFSRAANASHKFIDAFRRSRKLSEVQSAAGLLKASPLVGLFRAGFAEIEAQMAIADAGNRLKSFGAVERALVRAARVETTRLSRNIGFLATTAAATPFIGLFGTVWGIMNSFAMIGMTGNTSITTVAPGIAEALINTAAGLFAAIPALLAYNHFNQRLRQARGDMEEFSLEFLNLTERNFT